MKGINIIFLLFIIMLSSCEIKPKSKGMENFKSPNEISDSFSKGEKNKLTLKVDTVTGYICIYHYNATTQTREGKFESFYYNKKDTAKIKANESEYYNDKLTGNCKLYDSNGVLRTEYDDIKFDSITNLYSAIISIYNEKGILKKKMKIKTTDENDITLYTEDVDIEFIFYQK